MAALNPIDLYRLPWSLSDNGISWLEPTKQCNLACDGCYRDNQKQHKSFEQTLHDLDVFGRLRKSDALSIAGGDPLLYPDLVRTVAEAKRRGYKPVVNTNGQALTPELLADLKAAGMEGMTFHVDSKQGRAGKWRGKNELELCELRDTFAQMAYDARISCSFNCTVYPDTVDQMGDLLNWAAQRIEQVQVMVFILYRDVATQGFRYFNGPTELDPKKSGTLVYNRDLDKSYTAYLDAPRMAEVLRAADPLYQPCAYLNGTQDPSSMKWLLATRVGAAGKVHGYVGPKFMELCQGVHHFATGRYMAYAPYWATQAGRSTLLAAPLDAGLSKVARSWAKSSLRKPWTALRKLHFQGVVVIQPIDIMPDGRMNMCDGCPDITVWKDELVWSCRMDEQEKYGRNLWAEPARPAS